MEKNLTVKGDAMLIDIKYKALEKLEKYDLVTLNNITSLLNKESARIKFNKNVKNLKMFI